MNLYPRNAAAALDPALFRDPTAEYRGAPFWAWNCALDRAQLMRQIGVLKAMGMGGFHIHSRTGLATPYLGDAFMGLVRDTVERARQEEMLAWLYDEDRWPSGAAGGLVTSEPQFRARHLLFTPTPYDGSAGAPVPTSTARSSRAGNGALLARYDVRLRDGYLLDYRRLEPQEDGPPDALVWYAYLETALPSPWFNGQTYVDTLRRDAIERFVAITHERYAQAVGDAFGATIPAIFTDEPQFTHKDCLRFAEEQRDLVLPWTTDLLDTYAQAYGQRLEDYLPELFWELPGGQASVARYRYHDHVSERFSAAFADTLGAWCDAYGLLLTGHMMEEPTLQSQTAALGEAMRSYRAFTLPGIDMLCDRREYTTAKQAQSAAHQYGRPGVLSELYGVTNWDFPFAGHKCQGDWQAALGVTVRVPHLTWVSMAGEAKRDYPASIGEQSPWWQEYRLVEDHFARLNTVLTRGAPRVRVGVIHPIESYWLCFGPLEQTQVERDERERAFADLTNWLLFGLIDFDFVAESLLPSLCPVEPTNDQRPTTNDKETSRQADREAETTQHETDDGPTTIPYPLSPIPYPLSPIPYPLSPTFTVGEMNYEVVLVPPMRTIRATTLDRLERFQQGGGTLIFAGEVPSLVDAAPSDRAQRLAARCHQIRFARGAVLDALAPLRDVGARLADGRPADTLLHQLRVDGERRYLFLCNTDRARGRDGVQIALEGAWRVTLLDTATGDQEPLPAAYRGDRTIITWDFAAHASLLVQLEPGCTSGLARPAPSRWDTAGQLADPVPITLAEPNVLLLDQAAYRLDDEPWQPVEEILRLDTALRRRLGWSLRLKEVAQPWSTAAPPPCHTLSLRFAIQAAVAVDAPLLALEAAAQVSLSLDGQPVPSDPIGWWVDEAIQTVRLPRIGVGTHALELTMPYGPRTDPEWCYLLGDFGVEVRGRHARIVAPVRELAFGDWTRQGLPFYAGNVTYHLTLAGQGTQLALRAPKFAAPLLTVALDGQRVGPIAFAPFQLALGRLAAGPHALDVTAYGNRVNAFGCIHNADEGLFWYGPNAWRSEGDDWAYEYQLRPMGLLLAPRMLSPATR